MKCLSKFSASLANFLIFIILVAISINIECVSGSVSVTESPVEKLNLEENEFGGGNGGIIGSINTTEINVLADSENRRNNNRADNNKNSTEDAVATGMIPAWIERASSSQPPPNIRARSTKVLEKPLESQLISQFHEFKRNMGIPGDSHHHVNFSAVKSFSTLVPHQQQEQEPSPTISNEKRQRLLRRKFTPAAPVEKIPTAATTSNVRRQENEIMFEGPPSEIEFTSAVSPIEGSLGGLTGLQGLPPLSPVQFVKLLVAVTPFIIPLIFIPLLIFTIGLLMIPVTRANVFVDVGDLRSPGSFSSSDSILPSFISSYVVNPIKTLSGGGIGSSSLIALPRSLAYDLGTKLADTEQCVERISCEISARYLHSNWEQGNWRSIANTSWISRIINYLWQSHPTVSRIAKSLQAVGERRRTNGDGRINENEAQKRTSIEDDKNSNLLENAKASSVTKIFGDSARSITNAPKELCSRYTCQPKTFLRKFLSSPSNSSLPIAAASSSS